jgi:dihydrofolate reductase
MGKLKLQMGGKDFAADDEVIDFCLENLENVDNIILGRTTAEGFIPHWAKVAGDPIDPTDPDSRLGKPLTDIPKIVFSRALKTSKWDNATVVNGDLEKEMQTLKNKNRQDMIVYGGYSFVSSLIQHGLVDEFYFLINPVTILTGEPLFKSLNSNLELRFEQCRPFKCGTLLLHYKKKD